MCAVLVLQADKKVLKPAFVQVSTHNMIQFPRMLWESTIRMAMPRKSPSSTARKACTHPPVFPPIP